MPNPDARPVDSRPTAEDAQQVVPITLVIDPCGHGVSDRVYRDPFTASASRGWLLRSRYRSLAKPETIPPVRPYWTPITAVTESDDSRGLLVDALAYPAESDDAVRLVPIGAALLLVWFLLIPLFLLVGYLVRVVDHVARGRPNTPGFGDWTDMLLDGAKGFTIVLAFLVTPFLVGNAVAFVGVVLAGFGPVGPLLVSFGLLLWLLLTVVAAYLLPAAIANFARSARVADRRQFRAGFDGEVLKRTLANRTYAGGWLVALAVFLPGLGVWFALTLTPLPPMGVGALDLTFLAPAVGALVGFYAFVGASYAVGRTWDEFESSLKTENGEAPDA